MADDRYIIIRVAYEPGPGHVRSLRWIAPELKDADLTLIDRHTGPCPSRTWAGAVDGPTFQRLARAWHLPDQPTDDGRPGTHTYTLDGMNWETYGESPIVYLTLTVS
jgi:hypothetical protein